MVAAMLALAFLGAAGVLSRRPTPASWWTNRTAIQRGARDFATGSCISCHALAGVSTANGAIDLSHEGRSRSPGWLLREITHPTSQRPPTPPGQPHDLAAYLASLH
jgi:mono/diheme cytochrome c family protein